MYNIKSKVAFVFGAIGLDQLAVPAAAYPPPVRAPGAALHELAAPDPHHCPKGRPSGLVHASQPRAMRAACGQGGPAL